jgi:hypothetical protein
MKTERFTIKSFDVEAVQVTTENIHEVARWCGGVVKDTGSFSTAAPVGWPYIEFVEWGRREGPNKTLSYVGDWVFLSGTAFKTSPDVEFKDLFVPSHKGAEGKRVLELVLDAMVTASSSGRGYLDSVDLDKAAEFRNKIVQIFS